MSKFRTKRVVIERDSKKCQGREREILWNIEK
jgi:hypothetical protein